MSEKNRHINLFKNGNGKKKTSDKVFDMIFGDEDQDIFFEPSSTASYIDEEKFAQQQYIGKLAGLSYEDVKGTEMETDWFDFQDATYGSITEDERNIIQRKADAFYQSGPIGATAAAAADILPGIPFVDIIDPPSELTGKGMQGTRDVLGVGGMILGGVGGGAEAPAKVAARKAVGKVAYNIREPWGYSDSLGRIKESLKHVSRLSKKEGRSPYENVKQIVKSVIKDKPLYEGKMKAKFERRTADLPGVFGETKARAEQDARDFLYRKIFDLKPRKGKNIFIEHADGTLSFNPKSKRARELIDEIVVETSNIRDLERRYPGRIYTPMHSVLGGYTSKDIKGGSGLKEWWGKDWGGVTDIEYIDVWNFKMNPSDWKRVFDPSSAPLYHRIGEALIRTSADWLTKSPVIKGTIPTWNQYKLSTWAESLTK